MRHLITFCLRFPGLTLLAAALMSTYGCSKEEPKKAAEAISHALSQGTKDAQLFFHAGMIYADLGDSAKAKEFLQHALLINPNFHPVYAEKARQTLAKLSSNTVQPNAQEARNVQ